MKEETLQVLPQEYKGSLDIITLKTYRATNRVT
jgi:hypothetical protein